MKISFSNLKHQHTALTIKIVLFLFFLPLSIWVVAQEKTRFNTIDNKHYHLVKPGYDSNTAFQNPLNGWVMYASRNADVSYWDTTFFVPELGKKIKSINYASACYVRTSWASLNPSENVYAWNDPNSKIAKLIKGAENKGLPIAFRIVVDGRDQGANTPAFVYAAGAKFYLENKANSDRKTPYPQDPVFRKYYSKFIEAFAKEYNDPEKTSFIDAYGLGKWGEAHNVVYQDPGKSSDSDKTEQYKEEVLDWVTDLYTRNFTKVPLVINYHRLIGHPESWAAANPNSRRLLEKAINKGYSLRHDAFGMTGYYQQWEKDFAKSWNFKRPIIMEGGWIVSGTHHYWIDPGNQYREGHDEDVRKGEYEASAEAKVNMMDFRAGGETASWFTKAFPYVQKFISEGGYRLYPDEITLPVELSSGDLVSISHRWKNMGWGYCPNNIPQWNYKYKVAFALLNDRDEVVKAFVDLKSEPSNWIKDQPTSYSFNQRIQLPSGKYTWAIAIVDTTKNNHPGIKLAIKDKATPMGWNKLSRVIIK